MQIADILIKAGADVDATDFQNNTALHRAIINQSWLLVDRLIDAGCDVSVANCDGETALHLAVKRRNWLNVAICVERLLEAGANVNASRELNASPLEIGIVFYSWYPNVTRLLLSQPGADLGRLTDHLLTAVTRGTVFLRLFIFYFMISTFPFYVLGLYGKMISTARCYAN